MAAKISGGKDEMGWSAFWRRFNNWMDSSEDLISVSMVSGRDSLECARVGFIETEMV